MSRFIAVLVPSMLFGCPEVEAPPPVVETCTKLFEKCQLPDGPLGVCERKSLSDEGLACRPQH